MSHSGFGLSIGWRTSLQHGRTLGQNAVDGHLDTAGAFVDIGVHQDGLIHISQLADRFVRDPSEIVAVGDIVKVTVMEIDPGRRRIALSRRTPCQ
jgi:transcriptional accessory protein Tex/SPT6